MLRSAHMCSVAKYAYRFYVDVLTDSCNGYAYTQRKMYDAQLKLKLGDHPRRRKRQSEFVHRLFKHAMTCQSVSSSKLSSRLRSQQMMVLQTLLILIATQTSVRMRPRMMKPSWHLFAPIWKSQTPDSGFAASKDWLLALWCLFLLMAFSSGARILGECSTIHSPPALFLF